MSKIKSLKNVKLTFNLFHQILQLSEKEKFIHFPTDDLEGNLFVKNLDIKDFSELLPADVEPPVFLIDFNWYLRKSFFTTFFMGMEYDEKYYSIGLLYNFLCFLKNVDVSYKNYSVVFFKTKKFTLDTDTKSPFSGTEEYQKVCDIISSYVPTLVNLVSLFSNTYFIVCEDSQVNQAVSSFAYDCLDQAKQPTIYSKNESFVQLCQHGVNFSQKIEEGRFNLIRERYLLNRYNVDFRSYLIYKSIVGNPISSLPRIFKFMDKELVADFANDVISYGFNDALLNMKNEDPVLYSRISNNLHLLKENMGRINYIKYRNRENRIPYRILQYQNSNADFLYGYSFNSVINYLSGN